MQNYVNIYNNIFNNDKEYHNEYRENCDNLDINDDIYNNQYCTNNNYLHHICYKYLTSQGPPVYPVIYIKEL